MSVPMSSGHTVPRMLGGTPLVHSFSMSRTASGVCALTALLVELLLLVLYPFLRSHCSVTWLTRPPWLLLEAPGGGGGADLEGEAEAEAEGGGYMAPY